MREGGVVEGGRKRAPDGASVVSAPPHRVLRATGSSEPTSHCQHVSIRSLRGRRNSDGRFSPSISVPRELKVRLVLKASNQCLESNRIQWGFALAMRAIADEKISCLFQLRNNFDSQNVVGIVTSLGINNAWRVTEIFLRTRRTR